jgi:hypothetical protein
MQKAALVAATGSNKQTKKRRDKKMIREYKTLEGYLTNGLTWKLETDRHGQHLTILWANGEPSEVDSLELKSDDIQRLADLFNAAYAGIEPSAVSKVAS